jgi:hypothetical protein
MRTQRTHSDGVGKRSVHARSSGVDVDGLAKDLGPAYPRYPKCVALAP